jgi:hypothetical protein
VCVFIQGEALKTLKDRNQLGTSMVQMGCFEIQQAVANGHVGGDPRDDDPGFQRALQAGGTRSTPLW